MPKQKSTHSQKPENIEGKRQKEKFKEANLTDILTRLQAKRARRHTQQEEKTELSSTEKRQFYSEEDDELWAQYFHGTVPAKEQKEVVTVNDTVPDTVDDSVNILEERKIAPKSEQVTKFKKRTETNQPYLTLDATHTASQAVLYSVMYRETISKGNSEGYFSIRRLMKLSGLNSPNTVRKALMGLIEKRSIDLAEPVSNSPLGSRYRILHPRDIFSLREKEDIKIDPHTKKVLSRTHQSVSGGVSSTVSPSVPRGVSKIDTPTVSRNDTATVSKTDTANTLNKDKYNDDSIKNIESSSKSSNKEDDTDDEAFSHRGFVISLYEQYAGNQWRVGDEEFYKTVKDVLPDIIEAAIIASVLRSKMKINSFAYCKGAIEEFQESLPPGYLSHLRKEWKKAESKEIERKENTETDTASFSLTLPRDSYFEEGWLKNYISGFPKEEQERVKRLAERFDHFMLSAGERNEWVKNPTGTFIGLIRGEVNVPISKQAPTFEERVEEERRIEEEEKIREQERLEWEREKEEQEQRKREIEKEIREAISRLSDEDLGRFITEARKKYSFKALERDESILERVPYFIIDELYERGEEDWKRIWKEIDKNG